MLLTLRNEIEYIFLDIQTYYDINHLYSSKYVNEIFMIIFYYVMISFSSSAKHFVKHN